MKYKEEYIIGMLLGVAVMVGVMFGFHAVHHSEAKRKHQVVLQRLSEQDARLTAVSGQTNKLLIGLGSRIEESLGALSQANEEIYGIEWVYSGDRILMEDKFFCMTCHFTEVRE
jgi:hypothetical protein